MRGFMDIGSTVIKVVFRREDGEEVFFRYVPRDYTTTISEQVNGIVRDLPADCCGTVPVRICSSANGGIRVGLVSLSKRFSGGVARNLILSAGANLVYQQDFEGNILEGARASVDLLVVAGGVDQQDMPTFARKVSCLDLVENLCGKLLYAGNSHCFESFAAKYPAAIRVDNVLGEGLTLCNESLLSTVRSAYLDDIVDRQGIKELNRLSEVPIWPTPGVVNLAFQTAQRGEHGSSFPDPFILLDIGGATTDLHYGRELLNDVSDGRREAFRESNRHVFTDLGVFTSRHSTTGRLLHHERFFDFLGAIYGHRASQVYAEFNEHGVADEVLPEACFFLALDAASQGKFGMPELNLGRLEAIILTGGVSQIARPDSLIQIADLFLPQGRRGGVEVIVDKKYRFWLRGLQCVPRQDEVGIEERDDAGF